MTSLRQTIHRAAISQRQKGRFRREFNLTADVDGGVFHYQQRDDIGCFAGLCWCGSRRIVYGRYGAFCRAKGHPQ